MSSILPLFCYISTDEVVERYCYRSRNQYFMVTKLRNYSTTAEATMTKIKLSSKAIYLGGNPKKMNFLAIQATEIFDLNGISKRAKFLLFSFLFVTSRLTKSSRGIVTAHGINISWSRNYATTQQLLKLR